MTFTPIKDLRVSLYTCDECGACVAHNPHDDDRNWLKQHEYWHRDLDARILDAGIEPTYQ